MNKLIKYIMIIILLLIIIGILSYLFLTGRVGTFGNEKLKAERIATSNWTVINYIIFKDYKVGDVGVVSINRTDWYYNSGYINDSKYYIVPIAAGEKPTSSNLIVIVDVMKNSVLSIDQYSAHGKRLPMSGFAIIPPGSFWYHEIDGYKPMALVTQIKPNESNWNSIILSNESFTDLYNKIKNNQSISPYDTSQNVYELNVIENKQYYKIFNESIKYLVVRNNCVDKEISIYYHIEPMLD
ncbi:hypothetical protein MCP_1520 [Methanocella paludicola SANAE]|uniref:Uncharacterized protein n=1 Tax=Methanocella paludicola (strain DSM 17711 / JCM 13418 / NBRC 101707 / SANAE) TaxID=304371 RepID=D1YYS0_METPS|nr:hypothetical protein [Methanocella paludicola]BAI61592.1 hypothetical protein MCP_1520 [Methanocella paludicola SANAE]